MPSDNVTHLTALPTPLNEPIPQIVERIEKYLEMAKAGQIRAIASVIINPDGSVTTGWEENGNRITLMGGVGYLQFRMGRVIDESPSS